MAELDKGLKIVISTQTYNRIKAIARRDKVSMADVVRDCVEASLDEREKWELPRFGGA